MPRPSLLLGLLLALLLALPATVLATPAPAPTPTPTPPPVTSGGDSGADATPEPTPRPTEPPRVTFEVPAPAREELHVGYAGGDIMDQAPLLVAAETGLFDEVGLTRVVVARTNDVLADVRSGDLDIGVVSATDAFAAVGEDPSLQAIAGYRNYRASGDYRGEVLLAAPGLVAAEPTTVGAFLAAYIGALQLFADEQGLEQTYEAVEATDLVLRRDRDEWAQAVQAFAPFDGGFGSLEDEAGLGELSRHLAADDEASADLAGFIATDSLAAAQTRLGLTANPAHAFAGLPGVDGITVAMRDPADPASPIALALDAGHLADAGFDSVEVVAADEPLLGVLQGQVEFGVMDARDVAEATAQGLPLAAVAGHRNYAEAGSYGGDVIVASLDLLEQEGSTVGAFLTAYVRALQDLADDETAAPFRPHDGGFGDPEQAGGLGELSAYLGSAVELAAFGDIRPLNYAQTWWGLPPNPLVAAAAEEGE